MAVVPKKRKKGTVYYVATSYLGVQYWEYSGTDKREAERLNARRLAEVKAGTFQTIKAEAPARPTVAEYATAWGNARVNISASDDRRNVNRFANIPSFGPLPLDEIRPRHIIAALKSLRGSVSEKSLQNAYGSFSTMCRDAVIAEVLTSNPCVLPRGFFEDDSVERVPYSRAESAVLISHHAIPSPIRVLNALCLLGGFREGEACGRRWGDLDQDTAPLWAMSVATQYGGQALKTRRARLVPVHPELAALLEQWARGGFVDLMGRAPMPEDYIVPYATSRSRGGHHTRSTYYKAFVAGCAAVGVTNKSLHSMRHTMITLARRATVRKDLVTKITHNPKGDIVDRYTHHDWEPLCEVVLGIGSLFDAPPPIDARPTARLTTELSGVSASSDPGLNTQKNVEKHMLAMTAPSSIPGASTKNQAELGSENKTRQAADQFTLAALDGFLRSGDDELDALNEALHDAAERGLRGTRPLAKSKPAGYVARKRSVSR